MAHRNHPLRVAFIGTGKKPERAGPMGYAMARMHAVAYQALPAGRVELIAAADIVRDNAADFAQAFAIPASGIYTDYRQMVAQEKPDVVSICTWPHLHAPMVMAAAEAGVKGIFCEKPMADTWGSAKAMHEACERQGVQLAFNHQRRYGKPFRLARKLIDDGVIGQVRRVEFGIGNLYDYGSHLFDLSAYLAGETRASWVMAQIDYSKEQLVFGAHNENSALVQWQYANGVYGLAATGRGAAMVGCHNRAVGTAGAVEMGPDDPAAAKRPDGHLRYRRDGDKDWTYMDTAGEHCHGPGFIERAVADFIACVLEDKHCELSSRNALPATEIIFAAWHSARTRGIVELPLTGADDNALVAMVQSGDLRPAKP